MKMSFSCASILSPIVAGTAAPLVDSNREFGIHKPSLSYFATETSFWWRDSTSSGDRGMGTANLDVGISDLSSEQVGQGQSTEKSDYLLIYFITRGQDDYLAFGMPRVGIQCSIAVDPD